MNTVYTVVYVKKSDIEAGKFDVAKVASEQVRASDATRAISAVRSALVEDGKIDSKGDVKILEARIGF